MFADRCVFEMSCISFMCWLFFFFFKQKTAYEMRISDWSSDVCSSDLSVRSQRELFEHQIALEREELAEYPEAEAEELALIYAARGLSLDEARALATRMVSDPVVALDVLSRAELGLNPDRKSTRLNSSH